MENINKILDEVMELAKSELNENGNIGYTMPDGKHHIFIYVDDSLENNNLWYIIEPNDVIDGGHEPMGDTTEAKYNNFDQLRKNVLWCIENYFTAK